MNGLFVFGFVLAWLAILAGMVLAGFGVSNKAEASETKAAKQ